MIGARRWVFLGESTHGTHEFFALRSAITQRLVRERGFRIVAVEGEWAACRGVDRYVRCCDGAVGGRVLGDVDEATVFDQRLSQVLQKFDEFPGWIWQNRDAAELFEWLANFNRCCRTNADPLQWVGLDVQGPLGATAEEVLVDARLALGASHSLLTELSAALSPLLAGNRGAPDHPTTPPEEIGASVALRDEAGGGSLRTELGRIADMLG